MDLYDRASPEELMRRLGAFRQQLAQGSITAARFKVIMSYFRFTDDQGRVWTPGANSSQWYLWENGRWVTGSPPAVLNLPTTAEPPTTTGPPAVAGGQSSGSRFCKNCGSALRADWRFCSICGTTVRP